MLQSIDSSVRDTQALVLSPTRELATQIQSVVLALGGTSHFSGHRIPGGGNKLTQEGTPSSARARTRQTT